MTTARWRPRFALLLAPLLVATSLSACRNGGERSAEEDAAEGSAVHHSTRQEMLDDWVADPSSAEGTAEDATVLADLTGGPDEHQEMHARAGTTITLVISCEEDVPFDISLIDSGSGDEVGSTGGASCDGQSEFISSYSVDIGSSPGDAGADIDVEVTVESSYRFVMFENKTVEEDAAS